MDNEYTSLANSQRSKLIICISMLQTRQTLAMATGRQQRRSSDADASGHYSEGPSAIEAVRRYIESLPQQMPFRTEVRCGRFWRAVWTEFVVTLLFLVIGCGAGVRWISTTGSTESKANPITDDDDDIRAPLAIGLTVAALMQGASHISGCHLNPAVSIALLVTRTITPLRTVLFVLAQCLGAIVGASILYGLTPNDIRIHGLPATVLNRKVHPSQAFGVEFLTSLLIVITLMATYDSLRQGHFCFKGLPVGVAYIVGHLFGYRYTGASMNPARSLGLALITNSWTYHWVYWIGPILGGIIGGITYEYIRDTNCQKSEHLYHRHQQQLQQHQQSSWRDSPHHKNQEMKLNVSAMTSQETELTITSNDYQV